MTKAPEAEAQAVGCLLVSEACLSRRALLDETDFTHPATRTCFAAAAHLADAGQPVSVTTVAARIESTGSLKIVAGREGLERLAKSARPDEYGYHARLISEASRKRDLAAALHKAADEVHKADGDPRIPLGEAMVSATEIAQRRVPSAGVTASEATKEAVQAFAERCRTTHPPGTPTGILRVDEMLVGGLQPKRLYVLAGRPGTGKTMAALSMVDHFAVGLGVPCRWWGLEMDPAENIGRLITMRSRQSSLHWLRGTRDESKFKAYLAAAQRVSRSPLSFGQGKHPEQVLSEIDQWLADPAVWAQAREAGERFAADGSPRKFYPVPIVDHIHALPVPERSTQKEVLGEFVGAVKQRIAGPRAAPVVLLAQLNRNSETERREPRMRDLYGASAIEFFGDGIMFVHRDPMGPTPERAEHIWVKNRQGIVTGSVPTYYDVDTGRFTLREVRDVE